MQEPFGHRRPGVFPHLRRKPYSSTANPKQDGGADWDVLPVVKGQDLSAKGCNKLSRLGALLRAAKEKGGAGGKVQTVRRGGLRLFLYLLVPGERNWVSVRV